MFKKIIFTLLLSSSLMATGLFFKGVVDFGGEPITTLVFDDNTQETLYSHAGLSMGVGINIDLLEFLDWETTISTKSESVEAANGDISFRRYPLETLLFYNYGFFRVGAGISYHIAPTYSCDVTGVCSVTSSANNALGYTAEAQIKFDRREQLGADITIGVKYTIIQYDFIGVSIDGSGTGIVFGYLF